MLRRLGVLAAFVLLMGGGVQPPAATADAGAAPGLSVAVGTRAAIAPLIAAPGPSRNLAMKHCLIP